MFVQNSLVGILPLWIHRNLLIYILLPVLNEKLINIAKDFGTMYILELRIVWEKERRCCFPKYTLYISQKLSMTTSSCPAFWKGKRAHLPSTRVWEMLDAGALSAAGTAREPSCILPVLSRRRRRGNQCTEGRKGLLETQWLIRVRGNSGGKTDQQTLIMCDKKAGHALSLVLLDITHPVKAQVHLMSTTCKGYAL